MKTNNSLLTSRTRQSLAWLWMLLLAPVLAACGSPVEQQSLPQRMIRGGWIQKNDIGDILSAPALSSVKQMRELGIQWLAIGPEVHMPDIYRPEMTYGKNVESFRTYILWAKQQGLKVMLLPRIESDSFFKPPFPFRADIQMLTTDHTEKFFENYKNMLLFYGKFCQETGVDIFALGLEYLTLVRDHPDKWREMIAAVRKVYKGKLTYSANWYEEYEAVTFWDALDTIGVGAYFELKVGPNADIMDLKAEWEPVLKNLKAISEKYNKPILFTEVGYTAFNDAARYPWKWQADLTRPLSLNHQADCFQAMFETFANQPWFEGMFIWRFYTLPNKRPRYDYNPIGKPAANVIQQWFRLPEAEPTQGSIPME